MIQTDKPKEETKLPAIIKPATPNKKTVAIIATQTDPLPKQVVPKATVTPKKKTVAIMATQTDPLPKPVVVPNVITKKKSAAVIATQTDPMPKPVLVPKAILPQIIKKLSKMVQTNSIEDIPEEENYGESTKALLKNP